MSGVQGSAPQPVVAGEAPSHSVAIVGAKALREVAFRGMIPGRAPRWTPHEEEDMPNGDRYRPLGEHLRASGAATLAVSLAAVEQLLGAPLPPSARTTRNWWSNRRRGGVQALAWLDAGYAVAAVDLDAETVMFRRQAVPAATSIVARWDGATIKALRAFAGRTQGELAEELGVRQQTISEWETGAYLPTRASAKSLDHLARRLGFIADEG